MRVPILGSANSRNKQVFARIALVVWLPACASIPDGRYGISSVELSGTRDIDPEAIQACLVSQERDAVQLGPGGFREPSCGEPPFQTDAGAWELWSWPWTRWPIYDKVLLEQDLERIERFYKARGYYQAQVQALELDPDAAQYSDRTETLAEGTDCEPGDACEVDIHIRVHEGDPVIVQEVSVSGIDALPETVKQRLRAAVLLATGERFDEALYERGKEQLRSVLKETGYARAMIGGKVKIDRAARQAWIEYSIEPGPACVFGDVRIQGAEGLPLRPIHAAVNIDPGDPYRQSLVDDAERSVYELGAFSSVRIEPDPREGEDRRIDLVVHVARLRQHRFRLGVGVTSGVLRRSTSDEVVNVPQWDVHLLAGFEDRNFLGGLRRLKIEDRPRLIFPAEFPQTRNAETGRGPRPGNLLTVGLQQPAFIEARTTLFLDSEWDFGPDPFLGFFRHEISTKLGVRRPFFNHRLFVSVAVQNDIFLVRDVGTELPSDYRLPFFEQVVRLDLREGDERTLRGMFARIGLQEAFQLGDYGSWRYLRTTPEVRGYAPLPLSAVLAGRFGVGFLFIYKASTDLDPTSQRLGPQSYRLRGGGADSNRGFTAGTLGVGIDGGIRRWEGSLELRIPLMASLVFALFGDVGDVHDGKRLRFSHLNTALGFGLRYLTFVGPIRLDLGWRVPDAQVLGEDLPPEQQVDVGVAPSAVHLTIGESF